MSDDDEELSELLGENQGGNRLLRATAHLFDEINKPERGGAPPTVWRAIRPEMRSVLAAALLCDDNRGPARHRTFVALRQIILAIAEERR